VFDKEKPRPGGAPKEWPIRDIKEEEVYFGDLPDDGTTARSSSTVRSAFMSPSSIARRVFFTKEGAHTLIERYPVRGSGWSSRSTPRASWRPDRPEAQFPGTVFLRALARE